MKRPHPPCSCVPEECAYRGGGQDKADRCPAARYPSARKGHVSTLCATYPPPAHLHDDCKGAVAAQDAVINHTAVVGHPDAVDGRHRGGPVELDNSRPAHEERIRERLRRGREGLRV